jgi:hypothetical protein
MFTSLKVVNMAVSFLALTNLSATLRRNIESFVRSDAASSCRSSHRVAFTASSLVTLPSFPVPLTEVVAIFFHLKFFLQLERVSLKHVAAGELLLSRSWCSCCFGASATGAAERLQ